MTTEKTAEQIETEKQEAFELGIVKFAHENGIKTAEEFQAFQQDCAVYSQHLRNQAEQAKADG